MLMVVFGAGASYDSNPAYSASDFPPITPSVDAPSLSDRMPLANQLFENRLEFDRDMRNFPQFRPILPLLLPNQDGISIERVLQRLQDEAAEHPRRYRQLAAVRYYLQVMLSRCEQRWSEKSPGGISNQISLLDQIERWRKPDEQVCIVTFNYDLMLETALSTLDVEIETLSDYIASDTYKLIKLHGSVNWGREVKGSAGLLQKDAWSIVHTLIDNADSLDISRNYQLVDQVDHTPIHSYDEGVLFPAIAIPVETKVDYECPDEHLEVLRTSIPDVDKLLVVGWRAAEIPFLKLLAENLKEPVRGLVVAGNKDAAIETADRLSQAGVAGLYEHTEGGFTELVKGRQADEFLSR